MDQPTTPGTALEAALFPVDPLPGNAELTANALRRFYVASFPAGGGQATFTRADSIPGLAPGDYGPSEEPGGETIVLADDTSLYVPGASTFPRKTAVVHANDNHPVVKLLTAHAQTTKGSPKQGKPMAYQTTNRDRSGEIGVMFVIARNTPKEGNHRHEFILEYRSMTPYTSDDNPAPVDNPAPTVSAIAPLSGPAGTDITASGTNLDTVTTVDFQQAGATVASQATFATQTRGHAHLRSARGPCPGCVPAALYQPRGLGRSGGHLHAHLSTRCSPRR